MSHRVKILACSASQSLAAQIAKSYGQSLADVELQKFSDGEFDQFMFDEDIFSHAITGAGTMRFTKRISITDTIDSYEEIYKHNSLFFKK